MYIITSHYNNKVRLEGLDVIITSHYINNKVRLEGLDVHYY